jgi:hypothetical protein
LFIEKSMKPGVWALAKPAKSSWPLPSSTPSWRWCLCIAVARQVSSQWRSQKFLAPSGKSPAYVQRQEFLTRAGKLVAGFFQSCCLFRRCESKAKKQSDRRWTIWKKFDTSGKSPAYVQHRKNSRARARKLVAGFFNRAALFAIARSKAKKQSSRRRTIWKKFDTSGKSPAYLHHRKNFGARAGKLAAGFFNRAAFFRHREEQSEEAIQLSPNDLEKIWHVGQITGISSSSQEFQTPRRETGRGLFQSSRVFSPLRGAKRRSNPIVAKRFGKNLTRRAITGISSSLQEF